MLKNNERVSCYNVGLKTENAEKDGNVVEKQETDEMIVEVTQKIDFPRLMVTCSLCLFKQKLAVAVQRRRDICVSMELWGRARVISFQLLNCNSKVHLLS